MWERDVEIRTDGLTLRGSLAGPDGAAALGVVLLIHGSGPLDRNENVKGLALDVFNVLARALAEAGYASVRYDKRGCGQSDGDYWRAGHRDLVADARAWVGHLRSGAAGDFPAIYLLGHSEGTLIAAEVARRSDAVAGLVLVCPFIEDVESALHRQARMFEQENRQAPGVMGLVGRLLARIVGTPSRLQARLIERIKSTEAPTFRFMLRRIAARSLRELMAIDPARVYAGLAVPSFLLGAAKDLQCLPDDVSRIAALLGDKATAHIEPDLTHLLRKDEGPPGFLAYRRLLKSPIDPCVAHLVIAWLRGQEPHHR
jgi:pimeloyl-ACP methyl ester carboxylesterase